MTRTLMILSALLGLLAAWYVLIEGAAVEAAPSTVEITGPLGIEMAPAGAASSTVTGGDEEEAPAKSGSDRLQLPDGTSVPSLNGAIDAAPLQDFWGPRPYSAIMGIEQADGIEWYRHYNGSYSTTQMVWRNDLGRHVAMTRVAHPGPTPPPVGR